MFCMHMHIFACHHVCVCVCVCTRLYVCLHTFILTIRDALILDLQVLVCSRTGVWEDVDPRDHHALGPVVTPGGQHMDGWISERDDRMKKQRREGA